ncbi:hypothetical protein CP877_08595 [Cutibacterium modestum]|nr:hypothetical protein CP877_08595 [Cutibacterium modestum]
MKIPTHKRQPVLQSCHEIFRLALATAAIETITCTMRGITPSQRRLGAPQSHQRTPNNIFEILSHFTACRLAGDKKLFGASRRKRF